MAKKEAAPKKNAAPAEAGFSLIGAIEGIMAEAGLKDGKSYKPVPTAINVMDFYNARYFHNHETGEQELFVGLPIGKMIGIIGYTGTGKTTLAVQCGMSLIEPYDQGTLFHFDLENAWSKERTADITGLPMSVVDRKYRRFEPVPIETIYTFVKKVREAKLKAMAADEPGVWVDDARTGERIPVPTVILIDTVAALQTNAVMNEKMELGSVLAEPGEQAKINNMVAQRLAGMIGEPNITVMWVNHIRDKIDNGPVKKAKRVQYLGMDESVPGGHGFPQYADYYLKMTPKSIDEALDIPGKAVQCTIVKSRLSYDGRQFTLILSERGFENAWSNFNFLKQEKLLKGGGAHYFIEAPDGRVTQKFAQKNFADLYEGNDEFRDIVDNLLEQMFLSIVPQPGSAQEQELVDSIEAAEAAEAEAEQQ